MPVGVVLAFAFAGLDVTGVGMPVTLARDTRIERAVVIFMMVSRNTVLTKLALKSWWAIAPFNPFGRFSGTSSDSRCQNDIVEKPDTLCGVRATNLDGSDVR